jgi:putative transposase
MPKETAAIVDTACSEEQADLRAAGLMVYGHETAKYYCSPSTVQKTLKKEALAAPYAPRKRKTAKKPDVRILLTGPNKVYCYDGTDFYLRSGLKVVVVPLLDIFSRKNLKNGVYVKSFGQKDVTELWDVALFAEGIKTEELTILSDNGGQMKGGFTRKHMTGKWEVSLVYSRPHTPDDNPWIEAFIKGMKYHPACPESFETVQDVIDWVNWYQAFYNNNPHSALGYVRPNEEHKGLGDGIRTQRKENLALARKERLAYYYECKAVMVQKESGNRLEVVHNSFAIC